MVAPRRRDLNTKFRGARRAPVGDRPIQRRRLSEGLKVIKKVPALSPAAGKRLKVRNIDDKQVTNEDLKVIII